MKVIPPLEKVIVSSKVQPNNRVTLIRKVQKKLNVKVGDMVVFVEDEKNVVIKKGRLKTVE
jgi:bifunctional DNA-binding transcriptional regulator/antitoxin component of YhaV-PrlF toxin-antitoxin module